VAPRDLSHFNEKARWALDFKHIPHVRRAAFPGLHSIRARRLTGGETLPVLILDGQAIGDSTRIIEALEEYKPEPPLYPSDPAERARALALEDFFDEELGPYARRLFVHGWAADPKLLATAFFPGASAAKLLAGRALFRLGRRSSARRLGIDDAGIEVAWAKLRAALERFQAELQPSGYLVGDRFTVADLTMAAMMSPGVAPAQFPYRPPPEARALLSELRELLEAHEALPWVEEIYARHRGSSTEVAA
jgi:glutathione S-transferase